MNNEYEYWTALVSRNGGRNVGFHVGFNLGLMASWPALIPVGSGLLSALCGWIVVRKALAQTRKTLGMVILFTGCLMMTISFWIPLSVAGTGWSTNKETLTVQTGFDTETLPLAGVSASWVTSTGPDRLAFRTGGFSSTGFHTGRFRLANGLNALVFQYGNHPWLLITRPHTLPILISSPKVARLKQVLTHPTQLPGLNSMNSLTAVSGSGQGWTIFVALVLLVLFAFFHWNLAWTWKPRMPERMTTHWNFAGQPDGSVHKNVAMLVGPLVSLSLSVLALLVVAVGGSMVALVPFAGIQVLLVYLFRWVYKRNAT